MRATRTVGMLFLLLCCMGSVLAQQPFTYQGMLKTSGIPANGNYDFQFSLWTANSGGSQVGSTITRIGVSVGNGLFSTELDFGSVWDGNDRWVQEYGYQAEQPKPAEHRGKYLHPELYGQLRVWGFIITLNRSDPAAWRIRISPHPRPLSHAVGEGMGVRETRSYLKPNNRRTERCNTQ